MKSLSGLYFVRTLAPEDDGDTAPDVMYGQIIDASETLLLVNYYTVSENLPMEELLLEPLSDFVDDARLFRSLEAAVGQFVEMTRNAALSSEGAS
jgi:hypothetical protein